MKMINAAPHTLTIPGELLADSAYHYCVTSPSLVQRRDGVTVLGEQRGKRGNAGARSRLLVRRQDGS